jgi:hypothetical protein
MQTLFDRDCELQYYIQLSRSLTTLTGVLYITLVEDHYILIEHPYEDDQVLIHNSLQKLPNTIVDASYDVAKQRILTAFLGKLWTYNMV